MRTIVYIDGFNFFYGAIKGTRYKWLNIDRFFSKLRPDDDLLAIKYFTAIVKGSGRAKQQEYLRALGTTDRVAVIEGKFKPKSTRCNNTMCSFAGNRHFRVMEEKQTDVKIAVQMVQDAFLDECDHFILVTGDSDLVPPVACIRENFPNKKITVYIPTTNMTRGQATQLRSIASKSRTLPLDLLKHSMFPSTMNDAAGLPITKPTTW